jgi:hypothetical protein
VAEHAATSAFKVLTGAGGSMAERFRIDTNGNVGVGTAAPGAKLDVSGNILLSSATPTITFNSGGSYISNANTANTLIVGTSGVERMRVDSSGNVGIGGWAGARKLDVYGDSGIGVHPSADNGVATLSVSSSTGVTRLDCYTNIAGVASAFAVFTNPASSGTAERMRIDGNGSMMIGTTTALGYIANRQVLSINGTNDSMTAYGVGGTLVGYLAGTPANMQLDAQGARAIVFNTNGQGRLTIQSDGHVRPIVDNATALGLASFRFTTVYAATSAINTSDVTLKEQIADLNEAERAVAVAIKGLIKKFKFKDAVKEKGDKARIHVGVMAQEVQAAFKAEGLEAADYALFCSDTWYEGVKQTVKIVDGGEDELVEEFVTQVEPFEGATEVTRLGIRYEELLAFVIAAL